MLASVATNDDSPAVTAPAGWTTVRTDALFDRLRQTVYAKVAGPSEPWSYTWSLSDYRRLAGGITSYSGVDPGQPVLTHAVRVDSAAGTQVTGPSVTTTVAGSLLVHLAAVAAEGQLTPPAGMTERWETRSPNDTNTRDVLAAASDEPQPTVGDTGTRTGTATLPGPRIVVSLALRPANPG